jgi:two-component system cell cycle response regulator DivK
MRIAPNAVVLLAQSSSDDSLDMYSDFLRYHGFTVIPVSNTHDALSLAPIADIIITGIVLSGPFDGVELVRRLRSPKRAKRKPIIVLTACAWQSDRARAHKAGCDVFLSKPCLPDELLGQVRRLLPQIGMTAHEKSARTLHT